MKCKNIKTKLVCLIIAVIVLYQQLGMADISTSFSFDVAARVTTHPDSFIIESVGSSSILTIPIVADIDNDGVLDIICAGFSEDRGTTNLYIWKRDGVVRNGWPISISGRVVGTPVVGDLDGNGDLEVVVCAGSRMYIWHHDGSVYAGYPADLGFAPGAPAAGDVRGDFSEEPIIYNVEVALCDIDLDGKKEIIRASGTQVLVENGDGTPVPGWPRDLVDVVSVGAPVAGDVDYDGLPEIFLAVRQSAGNFIYAWRSDGTVLAGWPVNICEIINTPGDFISLANINEDKYCEILTGSANGWIAGWRLDGSSVFNRRDGLSEIYQPIVGDIDNDRDMEILATARNGNIYCYDHTGSPVSGWSYSISAELAPGAVLVDIDSDTLGDAVNPINDLELLFSANDGQVHSIDLPGDFHPADIQWGMYRFDNRGTGNWQADYIGNWSIFDNRPEGAKIRCIYDWNRGSRVIELDGAGLNNCYMFANPDGSYLNTRNAQLQWAMRYNLDFAIYVSIDTVKGRRYLYYTATLGDMLAGTGSGGNYIHHGLGNVRDGKWHTFSRDLFRDLRDAEPDNKIVDINAFYIQGSGRIDDVMFLPGAETAKLTNYAYYADEVRVSSGDATRRNINDNDPSTVWVSDAEHSPLVQYIWDKAIDQINKITIENVHGATGGRIFIAHSDGTVEEITFILTGDYGEIIFDPIEDVVSIVVIFDTGGGSVSVGEIGVYYDPNYVEAAVIPEEYTVDDYIQIRGRYFWNPQLNDGRGGYWLPHGIAYQTWNWALGQWQTPSQIRHDLDRMRETGANAIRVDFVWKHIETEDDIFDWDRYDMLLEEAQAKGMKVFPIIGYQWPPDWFPGKWYTMHPQSERHADGPWLSDILSYEDSEVRLEFAEFLQAVTERYSVGGVREDLSDTVAGWILGNEYGYLGLWSIEYDGYDPDCQRAFREWLEIKYSGDIGALNARWANDNIAAPGYLPGYPYRSFSEVDMPIPFGYRGETRGQYLARDKASWYDLTQWREESIAGFVSFAAASVRAVDPYHLISYAAVGMQWGEQDWRYHTEDAGKISRACSDIGAPLNFWSINNYPWGLENDELMTGKWGIERARHDTGLPVMVTETGFTSTETMYPGIDEDRQAVLVRNAVWETVESGAMGVCIFHWNDRDILGLTERERGFGIVDINGNPKPAYNIVRTAFRKMDEINIHTLLPQFEEPEKDIAFLWDDAVDSIVNRYEAEMHQLFGALKRLGFNPTFINRDELLAGDYLSYRSIVLPRNQKMFRDVLDLLPLIALSGVKIYADCDLPGIMDEYANPRNTDSDWQLILQDVFGIDISTSRFDIDLNLEDFDYSYGYYETGSFSLEYRAKPLYSSILGYDTTINMWKYRDRIAAGHGAVLARFDDGSGNPALIVNDYTGGIDYDTAISLFSLGDNKPIDNPLGVSDWTWEDRYNWMRLIYMNPDFGFNLTSVLQISGSPLILVDYRAAPDISKVLLSFKNYSPSTTETVQVTSSMLTGKVVEDLLNSAVIEDPCDGTVRQTLIPDGNSLLLAYTRSAGAGSVPEPGSSPGSSSSSGHGGSSSGGSGSSSGSGSDSSPGGSPSGGSDSSSGSSSESSSSSGSGSSIPADISGSGSVSSPAGVADIGSGSSPATWTGSVPPGTSISGSEEDSSRTTSGPASVIVLERDKSVDSGSSVNQITETAHYQDSARQSGIRTYVGNSGYNESDKENIPQILEQLPPMEQFQRVIEERMTSEGGIIWAKPEKAEPSKLEEVLNKTNSAKSRPTELQVFNLQKFIEKFTSILSAWWLDLVKKMQFAYNSITRRYA